MIVLAPLLAVGLAAGYWNRRWILVVAVTLIGLVTFLSGWLTGSAGDPDTPAVGGAIILAGTIWIPLTLATALGVGIGRATHRRKQPYDAS